MSGIFVPCIILYISDEVIKDINYKERLDNTVKGYEHRSREKGNSKTCVKQPLSKRPKIGFQDQLSLNAGQKYCRMLQGEHSAILLTFIKLPFGIRSLFCLFLSGIFTQILLYCKFSDTYRVRTGFVCGGLLLFLVWLCSTWCPFYHFAETERADCFTLIVFLLSFDC